MRCPGWVVVAAVLGLATTARGDALDAPALTAAPDALLAQAAGTTETTILREHHEVSLDDHDAATRREHWIVVVRDTDDGDDWRMIYARWTPARQDRPVIRARVIAPDGTVALLDPAQISEPAQDDPAVSALQAMLPAVPVGGVVEQEIVYHDHAPALAVGDAHGVRVNGAARTVIELSAPVARKARTLALDLPKATRPVHRVVNGRDTWRYELGALPADAVTPFVGITTAASWSQVAGAVQAQVAPALAAPLAGPAGLPRAATREAVDAIAAWLRGHVQVRGHASAFAAPAPPAETIAGGGGTSSDVGVVWLALLRQAGIPADLVLTSETPSTWLSDQLPGAAGFDRVMVRARLASGELWISPDDDVLRPGLLPRGAMNRPALVAATGTRGLIRTPQGASADHTAREVRSFVTAEAGGAQVTVVTRETGVLEAEQRAWFRRAGPEIQRYFEREAETEFAGTLDHQAATGVDDLSQPLSVTMAVRDAATVYGDREALEIYLYPRSALVKVPWPARHVSPARRDGFDWPVPHRYEIENRIAVPEGYVLPVPAGDRVRALGTARLSEHQALDGRTLIVSYQFDSGKPHVTAAELATLQAELARLDAETLHLTLPLTAVQLIETGKPREAIAEAERLIRRHPTEAVHHRQLAGVLLRASAGEAARREARAAIQLAPDDAESYLTLGHTLRFDTLARPYGFDWDRDGAIAALRKARALAPRQLSAAIELSDTLVRNRQGRYAEAGADLEGALAAARDAHLIAPSDAQALDVVRVLVRLGKLAEARPLVEAMAADAPYRDPWRIALAAVLDGPAAGIQAAAALPPTVRTAAIDGAAEVLVLLGRYDAARGLAAETRTPSVLRLADVTAHPAVVTGSKDPRVAAMDVMIACADRDRASRNFWSPEIERGFRSDCARYRRGPRDNTHSALVSDSMQSHVTLTVEGDAEAWRVSVHHDADRFALYLALDRGVAVLLGDGLHATGTGQHLDRLLERGRDDAARRLADWLAKDAVGGLGNVVRRMWGAQLPRDHDQLQRLAGVLLLEGNPARALALLGRCAGITGDVEVACHHGVLEAAHGARRWTEVVAQDAWFSARPGATAGGKPYWYPLSEALIQLGRFDDAERVLDDTLASHPDTPELGAIRAYLAARRGDVDEALRRADAVARGPAATTLDLNQAAWLHLTENRDLDTALELARRGVRDAPKSRELRNTLAAIEAEHGEPGAAMADLLVAVEGEPRPRNGDWFVIGRIYEQLGLTSDAIAAYRRVVPDRVPLGSCYELAARRLTALHASH